ncbi:cytochrome c maturation protein CcmE [Hwanghaeella grinnelliae]|uniref:Cytochrome c-type biogenesis protein CcmE n=1 Tax=Hwanghaeella grinnelliae TaxID=2500179 RepID=A0A3S2Z7K6_9PROT|nr:cytochrome c maturation protein CcmE [Hwanghaeella grinnelliae]RVU36510.1 cytochrome c maturation protein CcmE [Hwanghaeella grinnelliae]
MRKAATRKQRRMMIVGAGFASFALVVGLTLFALEDGINVFYGPTEVVEKVVEPGQKFRLGGLVEEGSVTKSGATTTFRVTDMKSSVQVAYTGILPDLFREGQGVVTQGMLDDAGLFTADEVLAKHDENYLPAEAVEAMKRAGTWKDTAEGEKATQ